MIKISKLTSNIGYVDLNIDEYIKSEVKHFNPITIFQSASGENFLFQVRCKDVDFDKHDFGYFINQTKQNTFENNRISKFIKLAKISSSEVDEFINCYNEDNISNEKYGGQ